MANLIEQGTIDMDFEKICRTCLSSDRSLVSIFGNTILDVSGSEAAVIDLLSTLMDIKITADDCLPERICSMCIAEVKRAQNFRIRCKNSELLLNNRLNQKFENSYEGIHSNELNESMPYFPPEISITVNTNENADEINRQNSALPPRKRLKCNYLSQGFAKENNVYDVVCLSDDEDDENRSPERSKSVINQDVHDSYKSYQIEISDDEDYDDDEDEDSGGQYDMNEAYPVLDYDAFKEKSERIVDADASLLPDGSNDYSPQFDVSDIEFNKRECPKCSQLLESADELKIHIKQAHTRGFQCNICKRVLKSQASLSAHITTHVPQFFPCPICGFKVKQKKYLTKHLELHNGSKTHKCEQCDELFYNMTDLRAHNFLAHAVEKDSPFKCNICGVKLPSQIGLNAHIAKHNMVIRSHVCSVCKKAFRDKTGLNTHYRVHTGEKPHTCQFCHRGFTTQYSLKMHVAIHTNEQFHKCAICFTTFRYRSAMLKHMEDHRNNLI